MQDFVELYQELSEKITNNVDAIKWVDLWNSQVYNLEDEHPFPAPAVFLAFRSNKMLDIGNKAQDVEMQVDVFLFYETFADTYKGSYNQNEALEFLNTMSQINKLLHASAGKSYSSMSRIGFSPIDTGGAGNLWNITYKCTLMDYSASDEIKEGEFKDVEVQNFEVEL